MGTPNYWRGDALTLQQLDKLSVVGTANATGFANLTINAKTIIVPISNGQVASDIANNVYTALFGNTATVPEIAEQAYSNDGAGNVTITGTPGEPFGPFALANTSGIGVSITYTNQQNATGPSWITTVTNWSLGHLPTAGEDAIIAKGAPIKFGLGNLTWNPDNIIIKATFQDDIGLPPFRTGGSGTYYEYRPRALNLPCDTVIGDGSGGSGPTRLVANVTLNNATITQYTTSNNQDGSPSLEIYDAPGGSFNLNLFGGTASMGQYHIPAANTIINTIRQTGGNLDIKMPVGNGNIGMIRQTGGDASIAWTWTELNISGGEFTIAEPSNSGTATATGGTVFFDAADTLTANFYGGATTVASPKLDCTRNNFGRTLANGSTFQGGASILDPDGTTAFEDRVIFDLTSLNASQLGRRFSINRVES